MRASFDEVDETLAPRASSGVDPTSEETTDRALVALRRMVADDRRHFLWVHYYDPHAPYVEDRASPWRFSDLKAYGAEVRRTDAAVARLVAAVRDELAKAPTVLLVTADHGEEFGEHGGANHGGALYDESTRIPVLVWANTAGRPLPPLPGGSDEIGTFLLAVATGRSFATSGQTVLATAMPSSDEQEGLVRDGWKLIEHRRLGFIELYDLRNDPAESRDLAKERPDTAADLRCRLMLAKHEPTTMPPDGAD